MELLFIIIPLYIIIKFIYNWIKVYFFLWGINSNKSSFKTTVAYMIGKSELQDLKD
jgi:hypothetical protein